MAQKYIISKHELDFCRVCLVRDLQICFQFYLSSYRKAVLVGLSLALVSYLMTFSHFVDVCAPLFLSVVLNSYSVKDIFGVLIHRLELRCIEYLSVCVGIVQKLFGSAYYSCIVYFQKFEPSCNTYFVQYTVLLCLFIL